MANQFHFQGKGVSINQPWASAVAFAGKYIENRSWRTRYRGPAIHASGRFERDALSELRRIVRGGNRFPLIDLINEADAFMGVIQLRDRNVAR